jgi:peptide-methionine (S)-S-oxide reductase
MPTASLQGTMNAATRPLLASLLLAGASLGCGRSVSPAQESETAMVEHPASSGSARATFGAGCFWCVEAIFLRLEGVTSVVSGYSGGHVENPTYRQVCTGTTGHAEAVQVTYDPSKVSYEEILEVFFKTHDPTTKDRQGPDSGPQYRSVIFFHDEAQRASAERVKKELDEAKIWDDPIVTEIAPFTKFYPAEAYHQNYFAENPNQGYCRAIIVPKVEKFEKLFKEKLKKRGL